VVERISTQQQPLPHQQQSEDDQQQAEGGAHTQGPKGSNGTLEAAVAAVSADEGPAGATAGQQQAQQQAAGAAAGRVTAGAAADTHADADAAAPAAQQQNPTPAAAAASGAATPAAAPSAAGPSAQALPESQLQIVQPSPELGSAVQRALKSQTDPTPPRPLEAASLAPAAVLQQQRQMGDADRWGHDCALARPGKGCGRLCLRLPL
jgi:hypothetical protein